MNNSIIKQKLVSFDITMYTYWNMDKGDSDDTIQYGTFFIDLSDLSTGEGKPINLSTDIYNINKYIIDYVYENIDEYINTNIISSREKTLTFRKLIKCPCIKFYIQERDCRVILFVTNIRII